MQALPGPHTNNLPQLMQENLGEVLKKMKVNGSVPGQSPKPTPCNSPDTMDVERSVKPADLLLSCRFSKESTTAEAPASVGDAPE